MKIILSPEESEKYFYNALCNGLDYVCSGYNLLFHVNPKAYNQAKSILWNSSNKETICYEDILMQVLKDGNKLTLIDEESEESWFITLDDVHKKVSEAPADHLMDMVNGNDDAVTADVILQSVFIGEVMFG